MRTLRHREISKRARSLLPLPPRAEARWLPHFSEWLIGSWVKKAPGSTPVAGSTDFRGLLG
jgi:hypothetical protein